MAIVRGVTIAGLLRGRPDLTDLALELLAGRDGTERLITSPYIQKTGLALAGFDAYLRPGRLLVFGESEVRYLESLDEAGRTESLSHAFSRDIPCVLITGGWTPPPEVIAVAERHTMPLLRTPVPTPLAIAKLTSLLEDLLAVREIIHGVLMDILGLGVLIVGDSGIGKSECALDLVVRGHRLVADDTVEVRRRGETVLIGTCPELTRYHMEIRGLGVINIRDLFGVASIRTSKRVELVVQLERWDPSREYDRLGLDESFHDLFGLKVPLVRMPVAPGRSLAILVEVAARNQLLRSRGLNAARDLAARLDRRLREESEDEVERGGPISMAARRKTTRRPAGAARLPAHRERRFIIVTGLSGSGKSHAIRALEDLGYFCIDNLPTLMIPTMAELASREDSGLQKVAIVVDVREGGFLREFPRMYRKLRTRPEVSPTLIFLEASHSALVRRFSETRRPHPLAKDRSVTEGIQEERTKLNAIRSMADLILDTSNMTVHELRDAFMRLSRDSTERAEMVVNLLSFGYKHGVPVDADLVFDVRCLPNPHFVDRLRGLTGRDRAVVQYMRRHASTNEFIDRLTSFLKFALPQYVQEGKSYLTVAIGCTGGQHQSVMMAEALKKSLAGVKGVRLRVKHRDS